MSLLQLSYRLLNSNNAGDNLVHDDGEAVDVTLLRATRQSRPVRSQQLRRSPQQRCVEQQTTPCVCRSSYLGLHRVTLAAEQRTRLLPFRFLPSSKLKY